MKHFFALILCIVFIISFAAGCKNTPSSDKPAKSDNTTSSDAVPAKSDEATDVTPSETTEPEELFVFNPKVTTEFMYEIYPQEMIDSWFSLVDAVLAGEDTFSCPDDVTYSWMIHQIPDDYFPVFTGIIEPHYGDKIVKDGVAGFDYKVSKEEAQEMIAAFEEQILDLMNKTMKPSWSDFENAISLYAYFSENYEYDYETEEKMNEEYLEYTSCYRFFKEGTGICHEISSAYSYLLMQAGIDATVVSAPAHQWSYVRINGKCYHIDPTYVLSSPDFLGYFMMTDEKREEDGYYRKDFVILSNYTTEFPSPAYTADDETFLPFWNGYFVSFDHDTHILTYNFFEGDDEIPHVFDYEGF